LETAPFDRLYTTYYLLVELLDIEYYGDHETWVRGHSTSLKMVPFENLGNFLFAFHSNYGAIL